MIGSAEGSINIEVQKSLNNISQLEGSLRSFDSSSKSALGGLGSSIERNEKHINAAGTALLGFGAITTGAFVVGTKTAMDFEAQISAVGSVAGASKEELGLLSDEALRLGADTTYGATEAAGAMEIMLKAGAPLQSVLEGGTEAVLNLAAATGEDVPLAAETATTALNLFEKNADGTAATFEDVADVIAQSSNASSLSVNDWQLALKSTGPIAAALGIPLTDLAAGMVILADAGIKGEVGATAMRNILTNLADTSNEGTLALQELGIATYDAEGNFRGLEAITHDLTASWATMTDEQKLNLAQQIAGKDGAAAFLAVMDAQTEAAGRNADAFDEASARQAEAGTASEQAKARMDNLKGSLDQLMGVLETITIVVFSAFLPAIKAMTGILTSVLSGFLAMPSAIQTGIAAIMGIVGVFSLFSGAILLALPKIVEIHRAIQAFRTWGGIAKVIQTVSMALRGLITANPIIFALVVAIVALVAAYKTNFLGFADLVDGMIDKIQKLVSVFQGFSKTMNPIQAALKAIGYVFPALKKYTDSLGKGVKTLQDKWKGLTTAFDFFKSRTDLVTAALKSIMTVFPGLSGVIQPLINFVDRLKTAFASAVATGVNPVHAALLALGSVFPPLAGYIENVISQFANLRDAAVSLFDAFKAFAQGNFAEGFSKLGDAAKSAALAIVDNFQAIGSLIAGVFDAIPWGAIASAMAAGASALWDWIVDSVSAIDWGAVGSALLTGAQTAIAYIADAASDVWGWIKEQVSSIPWHSIGVLMREGAVTAAGYIKNAASDLWNWITESVSNIPWHSIGVVLRAGAVIAAGYIKNAASDLWNWIVESVSSIPWHSIGVVLRAGAVIAAGYIKNAATGLWNWIVESVSDIPWHSIGVVLRAGAVIAAGYIKNAASDLWDWIVDSIADIPWHSIGVALRAGAFIAAGYIKNAASGLWNWIKDQAGDIPWDTIGSTLRTGAATAVEGLADAITGPIEEAFSGLVDALRPYINNVIAIVNGMIDAYNKISPGGDLERIAPILTEQEMAARKATEAAKALKAALTMSQGGDSDGGMQGETEHPYSSVPDASGPTAQPPIPPGLISQLGGMTMAMDKYRIGTLAAAVATGTAKAAIAGIGIAATPSFAALKSGYDASVPIVTEGFKTAPSQWQTPVTTALLAMRSSFDTQLPALAASTLANFAAAKSSAITNAGSMKSGVGTALSEMSSNSDLKMKLMSAAAALQSSTMKTRWESNAKSMASTTATLFNGMQVLSGLSFSQMASQASAAGSKIQQAMTSGAQGASNAVRSALGQVPGIISGIGGSAASAAFAVGSNISNAMASGMRSALGAIQSAASQMVAAADQALRARAMISSPSKLFEKRGEQTGEGYEIGIVNSIPAVARAAADMVSASYGAASSAFLPEYGSGHGFALSSAGGRSESVTYINNGDIVVQESETPAATADEIFSRMATAWTSTAPIRS